MSNEIKFRSRNGEPVRVILPSGPCAIVGNDWRSLPEKFHQEAYASGCVSDNMEVVKEVQSAAESGLLDRLQGDANLKAQVRSAIENAISENNLKAFTSNGNPVAKYINSTVGKTVPKHIRDAVWDEMLSDGTQSPTSEPLKDDIA